MEFFKKTTYEANRWSVFHLLNIQGRYLRRAMRRLDEVEVFPWEKKSIDERKPQTAEQMRDAIKRIASHFKTREPLKVRLAKERERNEIKKSKDGTRGANSANRRRH